MALKEGIIGEIVMWSFLGAAAVLIITHASGFSTAIGSAAAPVEYETSLIATAGSSVPATSTKKKAS